MKRLFVFFFVSLPLVSFGQESQSSANDNLIPGTIISGRVVDAVTKLPLGPYAEIIETVQNDTAAYYYTFTDKDGYFSFPLVGNNHVVKVLFPGYQRIKVPLDKQNIEIEVNVASDGIGKDGVIYIHTGKLKLGDYKTFNEEMESLKGPNIRVLRTDELTRDEEGLIDDVIMEKISAN